ncbi:aminotransferase [Leucobacter aridicollis]|uniref:aminotransferase n=1 Tax=Leucobacter aridicollis TaxID=283878 RepID=UPI002169E424|nr:aminotransferase [Leucobacter aridicollis]MCS3428081.1 4-aminobutyrate aminotransferase-like enzyme/Ser/Thr protein kinase RdoA (MazF antagonist) [Leucobacter aridicollis]
MVQPTGGLVRPDVSEADATAIASDHYGVDVVARELGSNQDRNFVLEAADGSRTVLRVDHPVFAESAREAQHLALDAYRAAGVAVPAVLPGLDGDLVQRWGEFAVRRSEFVAGESLVDCGYLAPVVIREFGALAAASVNALGGLAHEGLERAHMWDMRVAHEETLGLAAAITDAPLRERVLAAAAEAQAALDVVAGELAVQAIHGDLTDDNVVGVRGDDSRIHPGTVLDLGDLSYGWRIAELAVTLSSLLHHDAARPVRVLEAVGSFNETAPISQPEARAIWPLVVLRAALLVASGWRQLQIDGDNDYARERIAGEQAIFDAATRYPLTEMTEQVLAALGFIGIADAEGGLRLQAAVAVAPPTSTGPKPPLRALLPDLAGEVVVLDPGVEADALDAGKWLAAEAEQDLVDDAFVTGAAAAVFPYGVYRLTRAAIDDIDGAATWPIGTEAWVAPGVAATVATPVAGTVVAATTRGLLIDTGDGWFLSIDGAVPAVTEGAAVGAGDAVAELAASDDPRAIAVMLCRADAVSGLAPAILNLDGPAPGRAQFVAPERVAAWRRLTQDPAPLLSLASLSQRDEAGDELARRAQIFASAQERYYESPMQIERGWRHHLVDTTGRTYVDMVNNVTGLGHGHPGVADAMSRQIRILNTNSRFLYRELAEYSERLLALLPQDSELDTVLLVNSGSEAVDLALRLAQAATGRKTVVALREAYHGWTMASDAVTTSAYDNPYALENRPDWVHVADVPNRFRGTYRGAAGDTTVGARYAADLGADLDSLAADGRDVAAFICESVLGNAGGVLLPEGYLRDAYARVRAAGGLCIADEVQVGFGRMGSSFWGFEQSGVTPDIITIAKPMGNGFPIGGVITSKKIADALASQGQFFSSAGGNPLSCRVGIAVLDAMRDEQLQQNAATVGERLASGFRALAETHDIVGPIHGEGLYLGVELVRDRETMEPATAEAAAICERLRELGVVVLTTSERSNVLKVKPPLTLSAESADFMVAQLDRVLTEGW